MKIDNVLYNNIAAKCIFAGKKNLIIILPSAGYHYQGFEKFIGYLSKSNDVIVVEKGYFGIDKITGDENDYYPEPFAKKFASHFKTTLDQYKNIHIITQSIGSIYGYELKKQIKKSKLIAICPNFSQDKFNISPVQKLLLNISNENGIIMDLILKISSIKIIKKYVISYLHKNHLIEMIAPIKKSGIKSFLRGLYVINKYGIITDKKIDDDAYLIYGTNDYVINKTCNPPSQIDKNRLFTVKGSHSLIQNHLNELKPILDKIMI